MNIHGVHNYWKQGALGAAGVRRVWAGDGPQRAAYRGGGILCGLAHSLFHLSQIIRIFYSVLWQDEKSRSRRLMLPTRLFLFGPNSKVHAIFLFM